jgi:RNA exonuclease 1
MHPYVIDTSVIYNLKGAPGMKSKLSVLAYTFLQETIQNSKDGHCPVEDAKATMKLVKLKLAQGNSSLPFSF